MQGRSIPARSAHLIHLEYDEEDGMTTVAAKPAGSRSMTAIMLLPSESSPALRRFTAIDVRISGISTP